MPMLTKIERRQAFITCQASESLPVLDAHGSASDNAADTVGWDNRFDAQGQFTDEFIVQWYYSIQGILCEDPSQEVREFFESLGFEY